MANGGTLEIGVSSRVSAAVTVNNGGLLRGSGTVAGNVTVQSGGTLRPDTAGVLTVTSGNVTFNSGATFAVNLNGTSAGTGYSQLVVDTAGFIISLNGATLNATLGYTPSPSENLFIIRNQTGNPINGTFAGLPQNSEVVIGGTSFFVSYSGNFLTNSTSGGNDVVLYTPVPEASHILLLAAAAAGVIGRVRRRATL